MQVIDLVVMQATRYLQQREAAFATAGGRIAIRIAEGDPTDQIISHAREVGADAVAMATQRGSSVATGVLGSVTDRVVPSANLPVLIVRPLSGGAGFRLRDGLKTGDRAG